jgi:glycosyltransferase involved in cell wall biosynthesis
MVFRWLDRWMYQRFIGIAAISTATRDALVAHAGKEIPPVQVVLNGIDPERFRPENRVTRVHENTPLVLLSTGRLSYVKDQETIIRALAMVEDVKLVLAGDGPQRKEQEELAGRLGVRSRVDFLGIRTDIPQLIASSDIYIQASRWEGFCLAVAEAMCGGLPCIAARNTGLQEVVGSAGLYFEPGDPEGLAAAIRELADNSSLRAELSARGIAQARKFTLPECYSRYHNFYRDAIAGTPQ